jgi:H+/Cl- antiporter ClcA
MDPNAAEGNSRVPKVWQIVLVAVIAVAFTAAFMAFSSALHAAVWTNTLLSANPWGVPLISVVLSLIVGLAQRYAHAPTVIDGSFTESLKGKGTHTDYRTFPGALLSSVCSLLSGASVGPEGPVAVLVQDIAAYMRDKLHISNRTALGFDVAALAAAFNGIVGNPLFTGVFATEYEVGSPSGTTYLIWNLLAGVIGFAFYELLGLTAFAGAVAFTPVTHLELAYFGWAVGLGILGALMALYTAFGMQLFGQLVPRLFGQHVVWRSLAAGAVIGLVGVPLPELMFSGEQQVHTILADPAQYGVGFLLLLALLKPLLLALSFKSGYLGGPIFPVMFACTMLGMALHLIFPDVPLSILVLCIEGPAVALALSAPLTAIVLVVIVGSSSPDTMALIVLSTAVGVLVGGALQRLRARNLAQPSQQSVGMHDAPDAERAFGGSATN